MKVKEVEVLSGGEIWRRGRRQAGREGGRRAGAGGSARRRLCVTGGSGEEPRCRGVGRMPGAKGREEGQRLGSSWTWVGLTLVLTFCINSTRA